MSDPVKSYLSKIGKKGGKARSDRKTRAARRNGKKGGWPKGCPRKCSACGSKDIEKFGSIDAVSASGRTECMSCWECRSCGIQWSVRAT